MTNLIATEPLVDVPPDFPKDHELAAFLAWHKGMPAREAVRPHLGQCLITEESAQAVLGRVRRQLSALARRLCRRDLVALFEHGTVGRHANVGVVDRGVELLRALISRPPHVNDDIGLWLEPCTVAALRDAGIDTLKDLIVRVNQRDRWWVQIPWLGQASARRIEAFLSEHRNQLD